MIKLLKKRTDLSNDNNIVCLSALSVFLPYYLTGIAILILSIYILLKKRPLDTVFNHTAAFLFPIFSVYTLIVALVNKNYMGAGCSILFFLICVIGYYIRWVMNRDLFEKVLDLICVTSVFTSIVVIVERLIYLKAGTHRCFGDFFNNMYSSIYFHPNYLGSIMAAVILICAYKVVIKKTEKKYYFIIATFAAICMFCTESMFAWIEVFAGLSILLLLARRHQLLGIMFITIAFAGAVLYAVPEIFPRIADADGTFDNRVLIWDLTVNAIRQSPFWGFGFFAYYQVSLNTPGAYVTTHAHNIFLEPLLSFGIIGSLILFALVFVFFHRVVLCKNFMRKSGIPCLALSLTAAILIHSITDMTMLWIQTALLYFVVMGGIGADEQVMFKIFKKHKNINS